MVVGRRPGASRSARTYARGMKVVKVVLIGIAVVVVVAIAGDDELRSAIKGKLTLDGRARRRY